MIWALLALLGIPLWFIAVVLIAAFRNRNAVRSSTDVFEFKLKKGDGWARRKSFARWVSDVLIVHTGIALIRSQAAQVNAINVLDPTQPVPNNPGEVPTELEVAFTNGESLSIAVSAEHLDAALGPTKRSTDSA